MSEHLLSMLIALPIAGALLMALLPAGSVRAARMAALLVSLAALTLALPLLAGVGSGVASGALLHGGDGSADFAYQENYAWITGMGITYSVGVDGLSVFLVLLAAGLTPLAVLSGWRSVRQRPRGFFACLLLAEAGMIGALCARDGFLFYLFWELMLLPMFFLIGLWGRTPGRVYATVKFVVYTMAGSLFMLLAMIYIYVRHHADTGVWSFALADWYGVALSPTEQTWLFWCFVVAFAVKIPIVPLHTWLPDAYAEAPTPAVFLLSAVMAKLGAYGLIRFALPLFPQAAAAGMPALRILAVIGIVYGAFIALAQTDFKRLIAYASISHLGFVVLGIASGNELGFQGALFQMISHALSTGALFLLVGALEERYGTTQIEEFGGLAAVIPWYAAALLLAVLSSAGLPGLNGFVGEFLIVMGAFQASPATAAVAATGMIWGAWYLLWLYKRTMFGPAADLPAAEGAPRQLAVPDLGAREWLMVLPLAALMVYLGVVPGAVLERSAPAAERWARLVAAPTVVAPPGNRRSP